MITISTAWSVRLMAQFGQSSSAHHRAQRDVHPHSTERSRLIDLPWAFEAAARRDSSMLARERAPPRAVPLHSRAVPLPPSSPLPVTIRLTAEEREALDSQVEKRGEPMAVLIRKAIEPDRLFTPARNRG